MKKLMIMTMIAGLSLVPLTVFAAGKTTPGQTNMVRKVEIPKSYLILPLPRGELREAEGKNALVNAMVKDENGKTIGTVGHLIMDSKTGHIAYAVIELSDTDRLVPVPWSSLKVDRSNGKVRLNGKAKDLRPDLNAKMIEDQSPSMAQLMEEVNEVRNSIPADRSGLGVTDRPAAAGPFGEAKTGGSGPSGPRGTSPGKNQ